VALLPAVNIIEKGDRVTSLLGALYQLLFATLQDVAIKLQRYKALVPHETPINHGDPAVSTANDCKQAVRAGWELRRGVIM
jgi:hypothetical protein